MNRNNRNSWFIIKRCLIKLVAVFFVVYALADVTVLQAYCGNESVGIPPAHHLSNSTSVMDPSRPPVTDGEDQERFFSTHQSTDEPCSGDEECFCCCPHVTVGFELRYVKPTTPEPIFTAIVPNYDEHVNPDPSLPFDPPRRA